MALDDRDYMRERGKKFRREDVYYDPKPFRKPRQADRVAATDGRRTPSRKLLVPVVGSVIALLVMTAVFNAFPRRQVGMPAVPAAPLANSPFASCEPMPSSGSRLVLDPSVMRRTDVQYSGLSIQNQHRYPVALVLTDPQGLSPYQAVVLNSGAATEFGVPVGRYGLYVLAGTRWCSLTAGFIDGARVNINGGAVIRPGRPLHIQLRARGERPAEFSISYR